MCLDEITTFILSAETNSKPFDIAEVIPCEMRCDSVAIPMPFAMAVGLQSSLDTEGNDPAAIEALAK